MTTLPRHNLPPYQRREGETVPEKHARIRAEYAAAGLPWGDVRLIANDNAKPELESESSGFGFGPPQSWTVVHPKAGW